MPAWLHEAALRDDRSATLGPQQCLLAGVVELVPLLDVTASIISKFTPFSH
jgi:hypothetical protein